LKTTVYGIQAIEKINSSVEEANKFIFNTDVLIITLGTAWVYELKETGKIVANCHKMPQQLFVKRKLGINEIISEYTHLIEHLKGANQKLKIIFTVSPVKHLRDGFVANNWSKSTLNIAIHELIRRFDFCDYYPSYEIMNDDLRDYRFYKNDMVHPNELAQKYIFEHFQNAYCTEETQKIAKEFYLLSKSTEHKTMNSASSEHVKFVSDIKTRAERLMHVNSHKVNELLQGLN
jgi:GSCFA family